MLKGLNKALQCQTACGSVANTFTSASTPCACDSITQSKILTEGVRSAAALGI